MIDKSLIDYWYEKLKKEAEESGYFLNPDEEFTKSLIEGLLINQERFGYFACPCRLASGNKEEDLDIICPCDYRDQDINDYGNCYCGLYVSYDVYTGKKQIKSIPERRNLKKKKREITISTLKLSLPVWRCKICGYLCAREEPPEICPICKAKKERFERFI
ncbi:MAG: ferredoxin:glutaredoxin reductase [candidate division WOR-3 bacterium]|nr:ferredoxin:glutaredoxin reductase [candidate division WOR-3 bacterium]MCX7837478.1 ferredoxin:glutaredoxin reductase [candidate division WOR-3 bacterium]